MTNHVLFFYRSVNVKNAAHIVSSTVTFFQNAIKSFLLTEFKSSSYV